ncbi:MAG: hypothetical protein A2283_12040 [Lentisphaerae bacterium RIFOXYA12_FULL_48_11]|nr:MAG: hypothetical protein A2283_12040 [Lentisphaerae bacterium RIFOXYA12_FULL_48_11]
MHKTRDVLIVGTEPPCPRCDLLGILVEQIESSDLTINLRHCSFDSPLARELGQRLGRKIGTAKHVAKDAGIPIDWDAVHDLIDRKKSSLPLDCRPADTWSPDLDSILEPCQRVAESVGYLMTPILVVNGKVVHYGSVPSQQQIVSWLSE